MNTFAEMTYAEFVAYAHASRWTGITGPITPIGKMVLPGPEIPHFPR